MTVLKNASMRNNLLTITTCLLISLSFFIPTVKAHELKRYGSISVLIHINPDDDPVAGQPSELLFLTSDKDKKFNAEHCNCQASVSYNNEILFSSPLIKANSSYRGIFAPAIPYTFPHKGIFTVTLTGEPKTPNDFQPFAISYDIRVEKDASTPKDAGRGIWDYLVAVASLIVIYYFLKRFFITKNRDV